MLLIQINILTVFLKIRTLVTPRLSPALLLPVKRSVLLLPVVPVSFAVPSRSPTNKFGSEFLYSAVRVLFVLIHALLGVKYIL